VDGEASPPRCWRWNSVERNTFIDIVIVSTDVHQLQTVSTAQTTTYTAHPHTHHSHRHTTHLSMRAPRKRQRGSHDPLDVDINFSHIITVEIQMQLLFSESVVCE